MQNVESKQKNNNFLIILHAEADVVKLGLCVIMVSHEQISLNEAR